MMNRGATTFRVPVELKNRIDAEVARHRSTQTIEITKLLAEALEARRRSGLRAEGTENADATQVGLSLGNEGPSHLDLSARVDALERELRKLKELLREQMPRGDLA